MAAPFDLSAATTAEGQLWQLCNAMSEAERANVDGDGAPLTDNIAISPDPETATAAVTLTFPLTVTTTADGVSYTASAYLP
ncbi:MAG: hypothetical protein QNJ60_16470 [Xenococcaceae cyanobacterium MO_188.B19]|nr:hypothetical protein [Xenococcaceae cyanobacterium MO_188.B19]